MKNTSLTTSISHAVRSAVLSIAVAGCTWGAVQDANDGKMIPNATVTFESVGPATNTSPPPSMSLGAMSTAKTWPADDPNGGAGRYYLNPYAKRASTDTTNVNVSGGWLRMTAGAAGYDKRIFYRYHQYTSCSASSRNPYSGGRYPYKPYDPNDSTNVTDAQCANETFSLNRRTINYQKLPDLIVDFRTLHDHRAFTSSGSCSGVSSKCLRVSVGVANVGDGVFSIFGVLTGIEQQIFRRDHSMGMVPFDNASSHWLDIRLRPVRGECNTNATASACAVVAHKNVESPDAGCKRDYVFDPSYPAGDSVMTMCPTMFLLGGFAIQPGHGTFIFSTNEPAVTVIDTTGLASGDYWLEAEVNTQSGWLESDYSNNVSRELIHL